MFLGSREWTVCTADNLTIICEPIAYRQSGIPIISQPYRPPQPVTEMALPLHITYKSTYTIILNYIQIVYLHQDILIA
jgi:hypothetical protein